MKVLVILSTPETSNCHDQIAQTISDAFQEKFVGATVEKLLHNDSMIVQKLREYAEYLSEPNRRALIYYNGHGDQVRDMDGDETDGKDEVWRTRAGIITDDLISDIFNQIHENSYLILISDSCSSGTIIDRQRNTRPWICFSSCLPPQDSLSTFEGGVFTLYGLLPALQSCTTTQAIAKHIEQNLQLEQKFFWEVTRDSLKSVCWE